VEVTTTSLARVGDGLLTVTAPSGEAAPAGNATNNIAMAAIAETSRAARVRTDPP
jgi:hypothetical protein